ncbi:MAG TPA: peptidoglycan editing factor PgeF [Vicinamibacterales bacterium]|nr:peptidoglycan editing factor PgeF [Vicinamibacterales bacterium]
MPAPGPGFEWIVTESGDALVCRALTPIARHLFTTRSWQLGRSQQGNWEDVARALSVDEPHLARMHQVHGAAVGEAGRTEECDPADILVTDDPEYAIAVRVADCVPLLMADRSGRAVAAAHAGWRGLLQRVPVKSVRALEAQYGSRAADLICAAGPSIGSCCYEVGPEIREAFAHAGFTKAELERWFHPEPTPSPANSSMSGLSAVRRPGYWFFDAWRATADQLEAAGVPRSEIFTAATCTASHSDFFCSYRRDGQDAGRLAGAIRLAAPGSRTAR